MAHKTCDGKEYPPMMGYFKWKRYRAGKIHVQRGNYAWVYSPFSKRTFIYRLEEGKFTQIDARDERKPFIPINKETAYVQRAVH